MGPVARKRGFYSVRRSIDCLQFRGQCGIVVLGLLLLSACSRVTDLYVVDAAVIPNENAPVKGGKPPPPINLDTYVFPEERFLGVKYNAEKKIFEPVPHGNDTLLRTAYVKAVGDKGARNRLQHQILIRSHEICTFHKAAILSNSAFISFTTGLGSTILSGVSAALGGEAALSMLSSAVSATGTAVKAEFYQDLLAAAIVKEIDKLRQVELEGFLDRQTESITDYTIDEAIRDVNAYHLKCSFFEGVVSLGKDKVDKPMTRKEIDEEIRELGKEQEDLRKVFMDTTGKYSDAQKRDAELRSNLITTRMQTLTLMRPNAPGRVSKNDKDKNTEKDEKKKDDNKNTKDVNKKKKDKGNN